MEDEPRRIAIVGAGPSGLFTAAALLAQGRDDLHLDIFDRLPTPFGLLRYGVAPDHASIKAVATTLARVFEAPHVRFLGLVEFGRDVTATELHGAYDAVIYAVGAADDRRLGIPGEDLPGSRSARQFVAWYSGHPDAEPQPLAGVRDAVVIGVGNVAVDVARILLKDPADLSATDMPDSVLAELRTAGIEHVWLVGPPRAGARDVHHTGVARAARHPRHRGDAGRLRPCGDRRGDPREARQGQRRRHREGPGGIAVLARTLAAPVVLAPSGRARRRGSRAVGHASTPRPTTTTPVTVRADLVLRSIGYRGVPLPGVPYADGSHSPTSRAGCWSRTVRPAPASTRWAGSSGARWA